MNSFKIHKIFLISEYFSNSQKIMNLFIYIFSVCNIFKVHDIFKKFMNILIFFLKLVILKKL